MAERTKLERMRRRRFERTIGVIDRTNGLVGWFTIWLVPAIVAVTAWNTIARFLDRELGTALSSNTWLETGWYLFALLFLLGAGALLTENRHVRVDVLYERLTPRGRAWIDFFGSTFLLIPFSLALLWSLWPFFLDSFLIGEVSPDPGGLPRWPIKAALPIAFLLLTLAGIARALVSGRRLLEGEGEEKA